MTMSTPHAEKPHHVRWRHVNPWLVAVVALAAALAGFGTWMLVNRHTLGTGTGVTPIFTAPDTLGDLGGRGPDLTSVSVSSTSTMVTISATLAQGALPLGQHDEVGVFIDVPPAMTNGLFGVAKAAPGVMTGYGPSNQPKIDLIRLYVGCAGQKLLQLHMK
jgi:hypothetical protein